MSLKDVMAADISAVFFNTSEFAETVTYNGTSITAIPEIGEDNRKGNTFAASGGSGIAYFTVKESDIAWPEPPDKITYKNVTWYVARVISSDGGMHRIECTARESAFG